MNVADCFSRTGTLLFTQCSSANRCSATPNSPVLTAGVMHVGGVASHGQRSSCGVGVLGFLTVVVWPSAARVGWNRGPRCWDAENTASSASGSSAAYDTSALGSSPLSSFARGCSPVTNQRLRRRTFPAHRSADVVASTSAITSRMSASGTRPSPCCAVSTASLSSIMIRRFSRPANFFVSHHLPWVDTASNMYAISGAAFSASITLRRQCAQHPARVI